MNRKMRRHADKLAKQAAAEEARLRRGLYALQTALTIASTEKPSPEAIVDIMARVYAGLECLRQGALEEQHVVVMLEILGAGYDLINRVAESVPEEQRAGVMAYLPTVETGIEAFSNVCERTPRIARGEELQAIREAVAVTDQFIHEAPEGFVLKSLIVGGNISRNATMPGSHAAAKAAAEA